ncbi:MAG: HIT family protein [Candidatus Vogelbacteria bacterium CG10_big_fil_rev_8_21_14_0_10_49_38]|uniref:HIT family protein n=1 Tax=Candidatus Vogelbacteria bacterium CG10_big_fil_rev_8_21_14_0_10_49_38 TaxID=1975043 RepID=A0A2H0RKV0_9BACT|nr:MAG: hypothetical protein BK006_00590 [bacterium CG10_49_38]PIR46415.1 MAG: HIT family protein [Candidatus Vogelbacteria bacterium CG10_big_fil_rev_8_21_14_0_10_49_38]
MTDCLFCRIAEKEIASYVVYEDETWLAFLDINPVNLGHTLLVPKQHRRNLFDLPADLASKLGPVLQKLAGAVKSGAQADGLNVIWNNEPAAGQIIFHAHVHLVPRFVGDGLEPWPGRRDQTKADFEQTEQAIKQALG